MDHASITPGYPARDLGAFYPKGAIIFEQGEYANCLYVVQKGRVELLVKTVHGELSLNTLGKGEIFGASSLFTADKCRFSIARAMEDTHILRIEEKTLIARLHQDPSLSFRLIRRMAQRVYDLEHQKIDYLQQSNGEKESSVVLDRDDKLPNVFDFSVGYHILIIEDDPDFYRLLEAWLLKGDLGGESSFLLPSTVGLVWATTIENGLANLSKEKFDIIILDLNLPDSQGMESFHRIHDRFPDTPIVVLSGMDDERQAVHAVRQGAQDYLVKNTVDRDRLLHAMCYAIERRCLAHPIEESDSFSDCLLNWFRRFKRRWFV